MYNVTLRRGRMTTVAVEKQQAFRIPRVCLQFQLSDTQNGCVLSHSRLRSVWLNRIFRHYFINGTIAGKKKSY